LKSSVLLKSQKFILAFAFLFAFQSCHYLPALPLPDRKPKGIYHTVRKNETLWRICKIYKVSLQEVAEINNIKNASQIKAGDKIFIPGAKKVLHVPAVSKDKKVTRRSSSKRKTKGKIVKHTGMFHWPVKGKVVKKFGIHKGMKHDGINIKAPRGKLVRASYSGKVVFSSNLEGYGNTIIIQHKNSYATVYANNKVNLVKKGQRISRGQKIAKVGTSGGKSKTPYLHFQIRRWNHPRNPLFYLP